MKFTLTLVISLLSIICTTSSLRAEYVSYTDYFESDAMWMNNGYMWDQSPDMTYSYNYEADGMHVTDVTPTIVGWQNFILRKYLYRPVISDFTAVVQYDWNNYTQASVPALDFISDITLIAYSPTTELFRAEYIDSSATDHGRLIVRTSQSGIYDSTTPGDLPVAGSAILMYTRVGDQLTLRAESGALYAEYTFTIPLDTVFTNFSIAFAGNSAGDFGEITLKSFSFEGEIEDAPIVVPEPATSVLMLTGLVSFLIRRK